MVFGDGQQTLNLWHPSLAHPAAEPLHSHVFSYRSTVLLGTLHHRRHAVDRRARGAWCCFRLRTPIIGPEEVAGIVGGAPPPEFEHLEDFPCALTTVEETIAAGDCYTLPFPRLHSVDARDLVVTLMTRFRVRPGAVVRIVTRGGRVPSLAVDVGSALREVIAGYLPIAMDALRDVLRGSDCADLTLEAALACLGAEAMKAWRPPSVKQ